MSNLERVMDLWLNDGTFREELRSDPDTAVVSRGIELSGEERETLKTVDWNENDEKLQQRISQARTGGFNPFAVRKP